MSVINHQSKEITLKIVYYGPGLGGKTTNIVQVCSAIQLTNPKEEEEIRREVLRKLFIDTLPLYWPSIHGFRIRLRLHTIEGCMAYSAKRRPILKGADGIIFVADSQEERHEGNLTKVLDLKENLAANNQSLEEIPIALQYNKRDLPNLFCIEEMRGDLLDILNLQRRQVLEFEAIACNGIGAFETLDGIVQAILNDLKCSLGR